MMMENECVLMNLLKLKLKKESIDSSAETKKQQNNRVHSRVQYSKTKQLSLSLSPSHSIMNDDMMNDDVTMKNE